MNSVIATYRTKNAAPATRVAVVGASVVAAEISFASSVIVSVRELCSACIELTHKMWRKMHKMLEYSADGFHPRVGLVKG